MLLIVVFLSLFVGLCSAQGRLPWLTTADDEEEILLDLLAYSNNSSSSMLDLWSVILRVGDSSDIAASTREVDDLGRELVFGELTAKGVKQLLNAMGMMEESDPSSSLNDDDDVFLDLGSGTAIAVLLVASILPNVKALGVEYAVARHEVALERLRLLTTSTENNPAEIGDRVKLFNGNFLDTSLVPYYKDVTVVFSNSIMFSEETEQGIMEMILNDMPNVRFVVSGIQFHEGCYKQHLDVSWGSDTFSLWACDMELDVR
jgi:hypothetical protein